MLLVLEDDGHFRQTLLENLADEGYQVQGAAGCDEALALTRQHRFALVIADVRMAGRDGIDTLAELRKLQPHLRSIIITGYADEDAPRRAINVEVSDYLYKPFRLSALLESVHRTLHLEQDRDRGNALLAPLLAGYRKLVETLSTALANRQLQAIEKDRDQAYTGLFVAIRSRALRLEQAALVWDRLEELESDRQQLKSGRLEQELCKTLTEGYRYCMQLITAYQRQEVGAVRPSRAGQMPLEQFKIFYARIQDGQVPLALLAMAPFLRQLDRLALQQSDTLRQLYVRCWGAT